MAFRILISYASAGVGHRRSAEALYSYLKSNHKEINVEIIDILDYTNVLFKRVYSSGYSFLVKKLTPLWYLIYLFTYSKNLRVINRGIRYAINRLNTKRFDDFLLRYGPDIVISTHFLPCEVACFSKNKNKLNFRIINIITDFNVHPFWIVNGVDQYIVAAEVTKREVCGFGIDEDKIKTFGIPVHSKFSKAIDKEMLRKKFAIQEDRFTVLVITAAFGLGPIEKIVDLLREDVQLLVVCGTNNNLYKRLSGKSYAAVKIFGFMDNIEELMMASDIIITKPGGLTISESLAVGLPMIFTSAIYGQETKNAIILENYGIGVKPANLPALREKVLSYKNNTARLSNIREKINRIKKPFAVKEISEWFLPR